MRQPFIKIVGYSMHEGQYNIASMFKATIQKALDKYPQETQKQIASRLGISVNTLDFAISEWNISKTPKGK